jgi:hypothetical protein
MLSDGQQVYVIQGGRVVHLTTTCPVMKRAADYEQKSVLEAKKIAGGEPRVCEVCQGLVRKVMRNR